MSRALRFPAVRRLRFAALILVFAGCGPRSPATEEGLVELRREVDALRSAAADRLAADSLIAGSPADSNAVLVGLRTSMLRAVLGRAAARYFDDVRLHIRDTVVVTEDGDVRVRIGPVRVYAGQWDLTVSILRIDARLRADSLRLVFDDSSRIGIQLPVHVTDGSGEAMIDFAWDAATVTSVVCGDFSIRERFAGVVEPRTYQVRGAFLVEAGEEQIIARPVMTNRIGVSPQPTADSWARVREILNRQNHIFDCGLALSPPRMEAMLRDLLTRGFRFRLPESILRPLPLPASIGNEVDVAGRRVRVEIRPLAPRFSEEWLWLGAAVDAAALTQAPIRIGQ
ncbi:MAG: hypothetical protein ACRELX_02935 [Longimicrobiales bacterium]